LKYKVKDTPILKNKTIYGVGDIFPYTEDDKKLLWNLTEVIENKTPTSKTVTPKVAAKKKVSAKKTPKKKPAAKK
jgi:hypothetical protein